MLKKMVSLIAILFLVNLYQSVTPIIGESKTCSLLNGPSIRAFNEYVYGSHFNLSGYADEALRSHFFRMIGEDLSEKDLHNFTAIIETDESINNIGSSPNCQVLNRSLDHKHFMNAIFNGTSFNFEVRFNPNEAHPDPINLSIKPSDTDFFSLDLQNNLRFGMWLNVSRLLSSTWLKISSFSQPSANIQKFSVITELKIGTKDTRRNEISLQLVELPIGNHYMQFEINYEGSEGNFYVSVSTREQGNLFLPSSFYLDGNEVSVERTLFFRYSSYTVEFLKGVSPWIYGYRSPEFYSLSYVSPKQCMVRIDENSREQIEYLLLNAEIERVSFEETDIHGNPTYQIVLELNSNSTVDFGLMLYEKIWFLQPGRMKLNDIPSYIINKYTDPSSLFDGEYIDVDNSLVQLWAEQVVGNEINPYYIAYLLFQNLTETLKYDDSLLDFNYDSEFASATLTRRSGVCRHFAVAYAALCMDAKLPVRTVTGTAFGSLNDTRKKNHKWNEVYFPGYGWVAVDVTWKRFGVLSNAHSIYTHWQGYSDTLEVESMNQSRRLALKEETKKVLYTILNISKERLCNATRREESITQLNFEIDKAEELLSQLPSLIEAGDVHQSLVVMSEANLIINRLEIVQPSMPIDIMSFLIPFLIGAVFTIILLKFVGRIRVNADKQKKTKQIASARVVSHKFLEAPL